MAVVVATATVLGVGFVGVLWLGRTAQALRTAVTSEAARQEFVARWRPPKVMDAERLVPERVGAWVGSPAEMLTEWKDAGLAVGAMRGVYKPAAGPSVEVTVCRLSPEREREDRERAASVLKEGLARRGGSHTVVHVQDRWQMSSSEPPERLELWGLPGWLVLFRSEAEIPLPFVRTYLLAIAEPDEG